MPAENIAYNSNTAPNTPSPSHNTYRRATNTEARPEISTSSSICARQSPKLLHAPVAAELARRELGVEDEEVLGAIRAHTVGEPEMGPLALALYVADKIEPARDYPSVGRVRELAREDLREAATEALRRVVARNEQRDRPIHPSSRAMLEWLEETESAAQRRVE
jgi:predicted HD superfamily hydrolase involved in NAD metabolism